METTSCYAIAKSSKFCWSSPQSRCFLWSCPGLLTDTKHIYHNSKFLDGDNLDNRYLLFFGRCYTCYLSYLRDTCYWPMFWPMSGNFWETSWPLRIKLAGRWWSARDSTEEAESTEDFHGIFMGFKLIQCGKISVKSDVNRILRDVFWGCLWIFMGCDNGMWKWDVNRSLPILTTCWQLVVFFPIQLGMMSPVLLRLNRQAVDALVISSYCIWYV